MPFFNSALAGILTLLPKWAAHPFARPYVAGESAAEALEEAFGTKPVPMGGGGSIPIVVEFEERLHAPALLLGFSLPGCNLHAPNEWLSVENFEKGIGALALLYDKLGAHAAD